jgi:hypothetical protein
MRKFFKKVEWKTGTVYPQNNLASKGYAVFPRPWEESNGSPPKFVLLGRKDKDGKLRILRTQVSNDRCADIAVTTTCFQDLKAKGDKGAAEQNGVDVRFRAAKFWTRVRYRPVDTIAAIVGFIGAIATGVAGLVGGISKHEIPFWLLLAIFVLAMIAGSVRFWQDLRKNDPS